MIENVFSQFWTLELQDQGGRRFTVCDCCFLVHTQLLLPVSSCEGRGEEALWQLLLVYLFHHKGPILMTEPPPKCTLGIRFQHMNLGRHKHSVVSTMEHSSPSPVLPFGWLVLCLLEPPRVRSAQVLGNQWLLGVGEWESSSFISGWDNPNPPQRLLVELVVVHILTSRTFAQELPFASSLSYVSCFPVFSSVSP